MTRGTEHFCRAGVCTALSHFPSAQPSPFGRGCLGPVSPSCSGPGSWPLLCELLHVHTVQSSAPLLAAGSCLIAPSSSSP